MVKIKKNEENKFDSLALRLPCECNLDCRYCYGKLNEKRDTLKFNEIKNVILQGNELGINIIYIVGEGEPLLYPKIQKLVEFIDKLGLKTVVYSNLSLMTKRLANNLFNRNIIFIGKQNSTLPEKQNNICRVENSYKKMKNGIKNLIETGYTNANASKLEMHTVILKENIKEIPQMWKEWRESNISPQVQVLVYPSKKHDKKYFDYYDKHMPSPVEIRELFEQLSKIDKDKFDILWDPIQAYPIAPIGCKIHYDGIGISQVGNVQICSYTEDPLGNIREKSLKDILQSNKVKKIRNIDKILNYPEGNYGCRANAYNITGDRYAPDPVYNKFLGRS